METSIVIGFLQFNVVNRVLQEVTYSNVVEAFNFTSVGKISFFVGQLETAATF